MELTNLAQWWVEKYVRKGNLVIDATVGNGHDTLFLARLVGPTGKVVGFDIQEEAIAATRRRLHEERVLEHVCLFHESHGSLEKRLEALGHPQKPQAIMFNLGYLPGGNKAITTRADETIEALGGALASLAVGGVLSVVLYPGHSEGQREAAAVSAWAASLRAPCIAAETRLLNRASTAPRLLIVTKGPAE